MMLNHIHGIIISAGARLVFDSSTLRAVPLPITPSHNFEQLGKTISGPTHHKGYRLLMMAGWSPFMLDEEAFPPLSVSFNSNVFPQPALQLQAAADICFLSVYRIKN